MVKRFSTPQDLSAFKGNFAGVKMTIFKAYVIVHHVEGVVIKSNKFHLPKKLPQGDGMSGDAVIIGATEILS